MKTKTKSMLFTYFAIIFILFITITDTVLAGGNVSKEIIINTNQGGEIEKIIERTNERIGNDTSSSSIYVLPGGKSRKLLKDLDSSKGLEVLKFDGIDTFTLYTDSIKESNKSDLKKTMEIFFDYVSISELNGTTKEQIRSKFSSASSAIKPVADVANFSDKSRVDITRGYFKVEPILDYVSVIMGVISIVTVILLIMSTVIDLAFLGIPIFRQKLQEFSKGDSFDSVLFISPEAITTVNEVEKDLIKGYKNMYWIYFKKRALIYVVFFGCLTYLVMGGAGSFVSSILKIADNLIG